MTVSSSFPEALSLTGFGHHYAMFILNIWCIWYVATRSPGPGPMVSLAHQDHDEKLWDDR